MITMFAQLIAAILPPDVHIPQYHAMTVTLALLILVINVLVVSIHPLYVTIIILAQLMLAYTDNVFSPLPIVTIITPVPSIRAAL
jgi:hypothetical protein